MLKVLTGFKMFLKIIMENDLYSYHPVFLKEIKKFLLNRYFMSSHFYILGSAIIFVLVLKRRNEKGLWWVKNVRGYRGLGRESV